MKKLKWFLGSLITIAAILTISTVSIYAVEISGTGKKASPYIIENEQQLLAIVTKELPTDAYYKLNNDISLITKSWTPIGANATNGFTGNFDGNGHKISNLNITNVSNDYVYIGLFALNAGTISNLTVEAGTITGLKSVTSQQLGVIAGCNNGTIENCSSSGILEGKINSPYSVNTKEGGIAGYNAGTISGCKSSCSIEDTSTYIGGITGYNYGDIYESKFTGTIEDLSSSDIIIGGISGYSSGTIEKCSSQSSISGYANCMGGLIGKQYGGVISQSSSVGNINNTNNSNTTYTGGFVGDLGSTAAISDCFSIGNVSSKTNYFNTGGFIGRDQSSNYVKNSYCIGSVSGGMNADAFAYGSQQHYSNCFYNSTVESTIESSKASPLTDSEMKDKSAVDVNYPFWDFNSVWGINENLNNGYPYLLAMVEGVTSVSLSDTSIKMIRGDSKQLTATVLPEDAENKNIIWESSDDDIASVSSNGLVTAKGLGKAVISAIASDNGITATCEVNVVTDDDVEETVIIGADSVSTIAGKQISVPIRLTKNSGICGFGIDVKYDNTVLKAVGYEAGNIFSGINVNTSYASDTVRMVAADSSNHTELGILCNITFEVLSDALEGEYPITISVDELSTLSGTEQLDVDYIAYNGTVTISDCIKGDVNGDGQVTSKDATDVLLYFAKIKEINTATDREKTAADVNGDGEITSKDATSILLKFAGFDTGW